ncbi:hypothetical protein [Bacillus alkalicellulosilyticus]|uniref:hypothetical protein n=1 Tax=Alkalihalobacterium alkalicellulosilyticum TaxID=1912214 RepID=UPI000997DF08|nr:hypothetical protein [Bacillus alkalicellulosilyticus]
MGLLFIITLPLLLILVIYLISKAQGAMAGLKIMLLGLHLTIIGGILSFTYESSLIGLGYLLIVAGFIVALVGLGKND